MRNLRATNGDVSRDKGPLCGPVAAAGDSFLRLSICLNISCACVRVRVVVWRL